MAAGEDLAEIERRLGALEQKLDHVYTHLTGQVDGTAAQIPPMVTGQTDLSPRVRDLIASGNSVGAIMQYRAETGVSLGEARDVIDHSS